jgi:hypothetical protein
MKDNATLRVYRLDEIERGANFIPVPENLGTRSFEFIRSRPAPFARLMASGESSASSFPRSVASAARPGRGWGARPD